MKASQGIVVMITCCSKREALKIKRALLEKRIAACVNVISSIESFFWWQGKIDSAKEVLLLVKTKKSLFKEVITLVKKIHQYDAPEIIALPIVAGSKEYLSWMEKSLKSCS